MNSFYRRLFSLRIFRILYKIIKNKINYPNNDYFSIISKYKDLDLWDARLEEKIKPYYIDLSGNSSLYGHSHSLKDYIEVNPEFVFSDVHIQHGVYLHGFETSVFDYYLNKIIVMSDLVKYRIIENMSLVNSKKIMSIGPFIMYANRIYPDFRFHKMKSKLGRTLVVYLPHSRNEEKNYIYLNNLIYTPERIDESLSEYKKLFETIIVCNHVDSSSIEKRFKFNDLGYIYVVAGNPNDINFLSRQRTIMELADHSISYSVSTHVGYFISLGISHEIINLSRRDVHDKSNLNSYLGFKVPKSKINCGYMKILSDLELEVTSEEIEVLNAFYYCGDEISDTQKNIVEKYWGTISLISKNEIREFIEVK